MKIFININHRKKSIIWGTLHHSTIKKNSGRSPNCIKFLLLILLPLLLLFILLLLIPVYGGSLPDSGGMQESSLTIQQCSSSFVRLHPVWMVLLRFVAFLVGGSAERLGLMGVIDSMEHLTISECSYYPLLRCEVMLMVDWLMQQQLLYCYIFFICFGKFNFALSEGCRCDASRSIDKKICSCLNCCGYGEEYSAALLLSVS